MKTSDLPMYLRERMGLSVKSKYNVSRKDTRTCDGIVFDSKAEMVWYRRLVQARDGGVLKYFLRQVPFHLPGGVKYLCDFMAVYADGRIEFQDVKGMRTGDLQIEAKTG